MNKKKKFRNTTLRKKILFFNTLMVALLCFIFFLMYSAYYTSSRNRQIEYVVETSVLSKAELFSQTLDVADSTANQIKFNPIIMDVFKLLHFEKLAGNYFRNEPSTLIDIYAHTIPYLVENNFISRICLYNGEGDFVVIGEASEQDIASRYFNTGRALYLDTQFLTTEMLYEVKKIDVLNDAQHSEGFISIIKEIVDPTFLDGTILGYIEIQIGFNELLKQIGEVQPNQKVTVMYNDVSLLEIGNEYYDIDFEIKSQNIIDTNFEIVLKYFHTDSQISITFAIVLFAIVFVLIIIIIYHIQKRIVRKVTSPIIDLCNEIESLDIIDMNDTTEQEFDEIRQLNESFIHMVKKIKNSADALVLERTRTIDMQMLALTAHLNPHFIHNTLAIITALIDEKEDLKAISVSKKLSSMIRYNADYSQHHELLTRELSQVEDYLHLIKIRYEENFSYSVVSYDNIESVKIPKFTLQPLIENALNHSLKCSDYPWNIVVKAKIIHNYWRVSIEDNGAGIDEEKVLGIKEKVSLIQDNSADDLIGMLKIGGFSMMNTLVRMYLSYGKDIIFDITTNEKGGTTVIIGGKL